MRTWLYNRVDGLLGFDIFSAGNANNPPSRPFAVIAMDVEVPFLGMPPEARVQEVPFTVWVHDKPGSMLAIDDAAIALKNGLPTFDGVKVGNVSVYEVRWTATGADAHDDFYNTSSRPVRFSLIARR